MSVLINSMEMPKDCLACRLRDGAWCLALGTDNWRISYNTAPEGERLPDCPLVEVPPHGRLIDADALQTEAFNRLFIGFAKDRDVAFVNFLLTDAQTVIPADKEGAQ